MSERVCHGNIDNAMADVAYSELLLSRSHNDNTDTDFGSE